MPPRFAPIVCLDRARFAHWDCCGHRHRVRTTACPSFGQQRHSAVGGDIRFGRVIPFGWSRSPGNRQTRTKSLSCRAFYGGQCRWLASRRWIRQKGWRPIGARNDSRANPARESTNCVARHDWRADMGWGTARQGSQHLRSDCPAPVANASRHSFRSECFLRQRIRDSVALSFPDLFAAYPPAVRNYASHKTCVPDVFQRVCV